MWPWGQPLIAALLALLGPTSVAVTGDVPAARVATGVCVAEDPTTCSPPTTLPVPGGTRCGQWWAMAREVGWPEGQLWTMDRVMACESNCRPEAHNASGASGLLQIMPFWWHGRDPYDPWTNLQMGLEVWQASGWRAWSCY